MALVLESVQTSNSGTTSVTVTKPVNLAEGDLMVAHIASSDADAAALDAHTSSGWTQIATATAAPGANTNRATALYKFATAGDVAASDFTFTADADSDSSCGAIYRFTGAATPTGAADDDTALGTSHTFTNTITPLFANSIMLLLTSVASNGGTSWSAQAITTNNPTWTEQYDISNTGAAGDGDTTMAGASALRPETSATGDSTASTADSLTSNVGIIVAVYPVVNVTVSPAVIDTTLAVQAPTVAGSATVSPAVIDATLSVQAPTVTTPANDWSNTQKPSTTWTNTSK